MIPKIIHQIWKTTAVPVVWKDCVLSWRRAHPDFRYRLWTDKDCRALVRSAFPEFLQTFDAYDYDIQRADVMRYLILLHQGGIYADLDVECLRPLDPLLAGRRLVIGREPPAHARFWRRPGMLCNAVMAGAPGHRFWRAVLARARLRPKAVYHYEVVSGSGPLLLTDVLDAYQGDDVHVVESRVFCPFASRDPELGTLVARRPGHEVIADRARAAGAHTVHYWSNSWVRNLAGSLHNPQPEAVAGFCFYPGLDSRGGDIGCAGRDVPRIAELARARPEVVGFNTDGYLKWHLGPRWRWQPMRDAATNEGLYVRQAARWPVLADLRLRLLGAGWRKPSHRGAAQTDRGSSPEDRPPLC